MADDDRTASLPSKEELKKARARAWRLANPERFKEAKRRCYERKREQYDAKVKEWVAANREHHLEWRKDRYENKLVKKPGYRVEQNLRATLYSILTRKARSVDDPVAVRLVGCARLELKAHLEKQFKDGMSWENYGEWEVDHRIPVDSYDLTDPEQQKACFSFTNLQPLWGPENRKKRTHLDWTPTST